MKNVLSIHRQGEGHWVGDGFPVHTVFHYQERPELTPFILLVALFNDRRRLLHDMLVGTIVINSPARATLLRNAPLDRRS